MRKLCTKRQADVKGLIISIASGIPGAIIYPNNSLPCFFSALYLSVEAAILVEEQSLVCSCKYFGTLWILPRESSEPVACQVYELTIVSFSSLALLQFPPLFTCVMSSLVTDTASHNADTVLAFLWPLSFYISSNAKLPVGWQSPSYYITSPDFRHWAHCLCICPNPPSVHISSVPPLTPYCWLTVFFHAHLWPTHTITLPSLSLHLSPL